MVTLYAFALNLMEPCKLVIICILEMEKLRQGKTKSLSTVTEANKCQRQDLDLASKLCKVAVL